MNINNSINQYNNFNNPASVSSKQSTQSLTGNTVNDLKAGQVFEGSINSIDNSGKVVIGLANGQTMTARLDSNVNLASGQSVFFQVKSNDGSLVQIKPVSFDVSGNTTLLNALDSAGIIPTENSLNMVNMMMENSMSISSDALSQMNRTMLNNPDINPQTVVLLSKYNIPVNKAMANMFENYQSNEATLFSDIDNISNSIPKLLSSNSISSSDAISIQNQLNEIFNSDIEIDSLASNVETPTITTDTTTTVITNSSPELSDIDLPADKNVMNQTMVDEFVDNSFQTPKNENLTTEALNLENSKIEDSSKNANAINILNDSQEKTNANANQVITSKSIEPSILENSINEDIIVKKTEQPIDNLLNSKNIIAETNSFSSKNIDLSLFDDVPEFKQYISDNFNLNDNSQLSTKEVFNLISKFATANNENSNIVKELFSSSGYKEVFKSLLEDNFSLNPEEFKNSKELNSFYKKLMYQTDRLEKLLEHFDSKISDSIKQSTSEIKENISFMNTSNDIYTYLQVPIKMYDQNTDSTLYVRQNKKSSFEQGDKVTAYLHFDMEHLGSTDIYITLQNKDVSCKWSLADEKSLDLIENNIHILNKRLEAKGFNCNMQCVSTNESVDFVKDFLGGSDDFKGKDTNILHRYSFDMRA